MKAFEVLWEMLNARQRTAALVLLSIMVVSMVFEVLGIGMVIPVLSVMSGALSNPSSGVHEWLEWLGKPTLNQLILLGLAFLLFVYVAKTAFLLFSAYWQARFSASLQSSFTRRLYAIYLAQPWTFHLARNSSELARNIYEAQALAAICNVMLGVVSEGLVLVGIVCFLIWLDPIGTFVLGAVLGSATLFIVRYSGRRQKVWGDARFEHLKELNRHLHQGIAGAKDIKLRGCEKSFVDQFQRRSSIVAEMTAKQSLFSQIPRLWLELVAVLAICILASVSIARGGDLGGLVGSLGVFAAAAFRLLPSVNRLAMGFGAFQYYEKTLVTLRDELRLGSSTPSGIDAGRRFDFGQEAVLEDVTFLFPCSSAPALDGVTIRIPHGTTVGIIGGSGAGKSTAVDILLGLLEPTAGRVTVDGVDIRGALRGWQSLIGYVPQSIYLCDDSLRENVAFGVPLDQIDDVAIARAISASQLDDFVASLPDGLSTVVGERGVRLSGGQRQRIGIARALYHDPEVLVLDEATSALDTDTEAEVMAAVNALHGAKTIVIVAHRLSTVEQCDILYRLEHGRLVQSGSFDEVVKR